MTSDHMSVYAVGVFVAKQQRLVASFEAAQAAAAAAAADSSPPSKPRKQQQRQAGI
jgi:hypothetical protein